jgi:hypothetical protein
VRRFIAPMFTLFVALSTPLAGQALSFGFAGTLGGDWAIEAAEFGLVEPVGLGPIRHVSGSVRAGFFGDNRTSIISHQRGFVSALSLAMRSGTINLFDVGAEGSSPTLIGADVTVEFAGYLASRSPLPEGKHWRAVAILPALRVGQENQTKFALLIGPTWFYGDVQRVHAFLGVRIEVPLASSRGGP